MIRIWKTMENISFDFVMVKTLLLLDKWDWFLFLKSVFGCILVLTVIASAGIRDGHGYIGNENRKSKCFKERERLLLEFLIVDC